MEPRRSRREHAIGRRLHQSNRHSLDEGIRDLDHAALPAGQELEKLKRRPSGSFSRQMTTIYSARWVVPLLTPPIENGAVAVAGGYIAGVGPHSEIVKRFPEFRLEVLGEAVIISGLVNSH